MKTPHRYSAMDRLHRETLIEVEERCSTTRCRHRATCEGVSRTGKVRSFCGPTHASQSGYQITDGPIPQDFFSVPEVAVAS